MLLSRVMNLSICIARMRSLLSRKDRDADWAHDVCTASRMIHIGVWAECPGKDEVRSTVLPLLKQAAVAIAAIGDGLDGEGREMLDRYAKNDELRWANIKENYLQDKPSAFAPDERDP